MANNEHAATRLEQTALFLHGNNRGLGTGFVATSERFIVSAAHVIVDPKTQQPCESLYCLQVVNGRIERRDLALIRLIGGEQQTRDIAILKLKAADDRLPFLELGGTSEVGRHVLIAGFPLVFDKPLLYPLIRRGSIASTQVPCEDQPMLMLDMTPVSGFSGSAVIDEQSGLVVAVYKGRPKQHPEAGFSTATPISAADLEPQ